MKVFIKEFNSCVMRKQKIRQYRDFLTANGHVTVPTPGESNLILVWTCGFRADYRIASEEVVDDLRKRYTQRIMVGGCLPDIAPESIPNDPRVETIPWKDDAVRMAQVFGGQADLEDFCPILVEDKICDDPAEYRRLHPGRDVTFHDQFVKLAISEGCNFNCSYCSERLAFPPFRSFSEDRLTDALSATMKRTGVYDVILVADSLGQYGQDTGSNFPALLKRFTSIDPRVGLALNNLNPANFLEFMDDMERLIREGRIRHINLPIQSASPRVLKAMDRAYTLEDLETIHGLFERIGFRDFDTHVIVGFPGEDQSDFRQTVDFILRHRPRYVLASRYMEATHAPSAALPDKVEEDVAARRLAEAGKAFIEAGIICNTDDSELSRSRLRRMAMKT